MATQQLWRPGRLAPPPYVPPSSQAVLRGATPTVVELAMIPTKYMAGDMPYVGGVDNYGFRIQFASSELGDTATFRTRAPLFNGSALRPCDFADESSAAYTEYYDGSLLDNFISDDSFVAEGVENQVAFALVFAQVGKEARAPHRAVVVAPSGARLASRASHATARKDTFRARRRASVGGASRGDGSGGHWT